MFSGIDEAKARSFENCSRGRRKQDFTWLRQDRDPSRNVYGDAAQILPMPLDLSGMNAGAYFDAVTPRSRTYGRRAANRARSRR